MSFAATRWAWGQSTGRSSSKLVLLALADRADDAGLSYPSITTMALDTGLDRKTIMLALAHLAGLGVIVSCKGVGKASRYQLNLDCQVSGVVKPVPKTVPVQETEPVPKTGPHQYQKRDYTSTKNGTRTYQLTYQEPNTPPIPPPTQTLVVADATGGEVASAGETGQGNAGFMDFWAAYPRKQAKRAAIAAWKKLRPSPALVARILADVRHRHQHDPGWQRGYTPHPATYLNGARWEDDLNTTTGDSHAGHSESTAEKWDRLNRTPLADLLAGLDEPAAAERWVAGEIVSGDEGGIRGTVVVPISHARGYGGTQNRVVGAHS